MPIFSLKTLLLLTALSSVGAGALSRPTLAGAMIAGMISLVCFVLLIAFGIYKKRPGLILIACVGGLYLFIADGGAYPKAERYLPTEWALSRCSSSGTVMDNGLKRSDSLTRWASNVWFDQRQKDRHEVSQLETRRHVQRRPTDVDDAITLTTISLPAFKFTPVTTVRQVSNRDRPHNRPFFVIGHCCFFLTIAITVLLARGQKNRPTRAVATGTQNR